jgi:L-serine/L-threonine ammonia-lyase
MNGLKPNVHKDDHRILAEPACAAAITVAYNLKKYLNEDYENVVVEVCGGSSITLKDLDNYRKQFDV